MATRYKGGNMGFWDVPETEAVLERSLPETDHAICGGTFECPELCIFQQGFAFRMVPRYKGGNVDSWDVPEIEAKRNVVAPPSLAAFPAPCANRAYNGKKSMSARSASFVGLAPADQTRQNRWS
jgi:hypothetical protein